MVLGDRMRIYNDNTGFSILEVLICVMIIMLSISLIKVGIKTSDDMLVRYEAMRIVNELRIMQENSRIHFKNNYFSIDRKSNSRKFIIYLSNGYYIRENTDKYDVYMLPKGMEIMMNRKSIVFNYDGSCTNTTITLNKNNSSAEVIVDTAGRVRLNYE